MTITSILRFLYIFWGSGLLCGAVYHEKPFSTVDRHIDCSPDTQPIISYTFFLVLFYHSALPPFSSFVKANHLEDCFWKER